MKDNLSIIILMIIFVMLIVLFPVYNFFERQDDMSYNLVLKETTKFVETVANNGYLDDETYTSYIYALAATNNLYDIKLEAHKQYITKDPDGSNLFVTQYKVEYTDDILSVVGEDINSPTLTEKKIKNNIYTFEEGDSFYVKIENSNTTMAGALFDSIISTSSTKRISVNYGAKIKHATWKVTDNIYVAVNQKPNVNTLYTSKVNKDPANVTTTGTQISISDVTYENNTNKKNDVHYELCNGEFEKIATYQQLVHVCLNKIESTKATCPASLESTFTKCESVNEVNAVRCNVCGRLAINLEFNLKCGLCGKTDKITYGKCANCLINELGLKKYIDLKFIIGEHESDKNYTGEKVYQNVNVYKCKTCDVSYKEYVPINKKCSTCKINISISEAIEGTKTHNYILKKESD